MIWIFFILLILILVAFDLGVLNKKEEQVSMEKSLKMTGFWFLLALLFGLVVYVMYARNYFDLNPTHIPAQEAMLDYYTGYLIEESLSLDNIFVIALIFKFFKIQNRFQHKILFWGIIGAIVFRLGMILLGTAFITHFSWASYVFGGVLIFSGLKMLSGDDESKDFKDSLGVRLLSKVFPIDWSDHSGRYFILRNGKRFATVYFAAIIVVEFSDILFAIDSLPAIFSITTDPFIVFSSNIFAILGLRNLYFFLSNMLDRFHYMKFALVGVLLFVGIKLVLQNHYHIPTFISLLVIIGLITGGIIYSLYRSKKTAH